MIPALPGCVDEIISVLNNNSEFLIAGHLRPDGDCLGSALGLMTLLRNMGKKVTFYTPGPMPDCFPYLPGYDEIVTVPPDIVPPVCIYVDSSDFDRVDEHFRPQNTLVVNIDHHLSNAGFGAINWVDTEAAAVGEQIYQLAVAMNQPITPEIATCLYTAIMTDSGGFRFSNTDTVTFETAAHLVRSGANPAKIAEAVYDSRKPASVLLTGEVYSSLRFEFGGRLVWSEITRDIYDRLGSDQIEPEGLSSDIRGIRGVEMSVLFYETPESYCRIGFRSKGQVNVSKIAQMLGGGGHHNASGAMLREVFPQAREHALQTVREYLRQHYSDWS